MTTSTDTPAHPGPSQQKDEPQTAGRSGEGAASALAHLQTQARQAWRREPEPAQEGERKAG